MPVRKKSAKAAEQPDRPREPTLGDRVRIVGPDGPDDIGTLIEDYAEFTVDRKELNRTWAPMRRWAIALECGTLAFADDVEIHVADEPPGSTSESDTADDSIDLVDETDPIAITATDITQ